ncbi:cyclin-T2a isoform X1 [Electrophorus electricus]|uniref:Cyclin-like domain-containing protein n=1 Tax=Electrophorus electricus TaxID=8005 RepID=A0A4W4HHQ6_ELEEL|nr:cyclin-T2a isoform X1 [Electrophorus electricus]
MAAHRGSSMKWFFTREQLETTPSRRCGVEPDRELSYRQQAANLIQDMGQRLNVSQLTINTAIVYMHRFYMYHSFTKFHRNIISPTTLFLAAKVEEQPRKLEHVIKVAHACLNPQEPPLDTKSNAYLQQAQELVILETIVLQTLGFEITIEHPHTDVVKCSQLVRASKDLAQTSYFMATNSLHLTTFCLQYKPTVIACVCIHLACKWSNWEIPVSTDGKHWWEYVDSSVTLELLDELTHEFLQILEKTPSRLKRIRNWRATQAAKKPKGDGQPSDNSSLGCPSAIIHDQSMMDAIPGMSANATFLKASASFPVTLPGNLGGSLCLDSVANLQGTSYALSGPGDWPQDQGQRLDPYSSKQLPSLHALRPDRGIEFNPVKHEQKGNSGGKHTAPSCLPPPTPASAPPTQKMSLERYKEKHAAELAAQKRRQEQQQQGTDALDMHAGSAQAEHRKHPQAHTYGQQGSSSAGPSSTASPLKVKLPLLAQDKPQGEKRDKGSSLKLRLPIPAPGEKGSSSREELKMKIKVSSERHGSSDESGGKSKRPSLPLSKERHRDHSAHRHFHAHGGNGRSAPEAPSPAAALRSPPGLSGEGPSGSSRKRTHGDSGHNHHSKKSKSSRNSAGSPSHCSSVQQCVSSPSSDLNPPFPSPPPVTHQVGFGQLSTLARLGRRPVGSRGPEEAAWTPGTIGLRTDYKDSFDMLDSLLSAQGINL